MAKSNDIYGRAKKIGKQLSRELGKSPLAKASRQSPKRIKTKRRKGNSLF